MLMKFDEKFSSYDDIVALHWIVHLFLLAFNFRRLNFGEPKEVAADGSVQPLEYQL
jgi:hypothetical protein